MSTQSANKTLFLIRHAKSSWNDNNLRDFDRPLNDRGQRDAPLMAESLAKLHVDIDLIIASPAKRTFDTAIIFAMALNYPENKILKCTNIYDASCAQLFDVVIHLEDSYEKVACFAHNPSITELSNYLSPDVIDHIPTCGIVQLYFEATRWMDIQSRSGSLCEFNYPKIYR